MMTLCAPLTNGRVKNRSSNQEVSIETKSEDLELQLHHNDIIISMMSYPVPSSQKPEQEPDQTIQYTKQ